jgi:hypothetical protein
METAMQSQRELITNTGLVRTSISEESLISKAANETVDFAEGKKESIESAKFSAETTVKDSRLKETVGRSLGGLLGILLLFGAITNVAKDIKEKKKSPWIFSRIIMDFTASGALIGYAIGYTLQGISLGALIGIATVIFELIYSRKK